MQKQKAWENSIESPMCNHPYFAGIAIFRRQNFSQRRESALLTSNKVSMNYFAQQNGAVYGLEERLLLRGRLLSKGAYFQVIIFSIGHFYIHAIEYICIVV